MNILVIHRGTLIADDFDGTVSALHDALEDEPNITDPAIGATSGDGAIEVAVIVNEATIYAGQTTGSAAIRSAMHSIGISTPDWIETTSPVGEFTASELICCVLLHSPLQSNA